MKKILITLAAALLGGVAAPAQDHALARLSVIAIRDSADHAAEQISQALMGTPVSVLEKRQYWSRVRTPDNYEGWMINHSLVFLTPQEYARWKGAPKVMVTEPYEQHDADRRTDLVHGDVLIDLGDSLELPDGRKILRPAGVTPIRELPREFHPEQLPRFAEQYYGIPYLWGGLSSKGTDCSGLVRMAYMGQGRILPRDARLMVHEGEEVSRDSLRAGDLLFFGNAKTGRITHVAIYDRDGEYVHSSQLVKRNSLDPSSPIYLPITLLHCRRMSGTHIADLY